jgi:transposase
MEKSDGRKLSIEALNERRRRAVKMRLAGATIMEAVEQCELGRSAVIRASQAYVRCAGGRPKGSGRLLSQAEEWEVQALIQDRTPDQLKMDYALWTRQAVGELIDVRYGIRL